jgi:ribosomal protein S18 acetylase RimI-like enzyme
MENRWFMQETLPPGITIRTAVREDDSAIRAIVRGERLNPLGYDWKNFLVAADAGGRILGIGAVKRHGDGSRELASIATVPDRRGRGIASAVIRTILDREGAAGPLYLTCRARMAPFYERFGFRVVGEGEMPPYFRRLYRLVAGVVRFLGGESELRVMRNE